MSYLRAETVIAIAVSAAAAVFDLRIRKIPVWLPFLAALSGLAVLMVRQEELLPVLPALLPGAVLFLLSFSSGGGLGSGDALFVFSLGFLLRWDRLCILLGFVFFLAGITGLAVFTAGVLNGRNNGRKTLPLLVFFPAGLVFMFVCGML